MCRTWSETPKIGFLASRLTDINRIRKTENGVIYNNFNQTNLVTVPFEDCLSLDITDTVLSVTLLRDGLLPPVVPGGFVPEVSILTLGAFVGGFRP